MTRILVWDLPTRLFKWLFALGFLTAFAIAQLSSEHSAFFPYHMLIGLVLGLMLILRLLWGFIGTRHARFRSFLFKPASAFEYMRGALSGAGKRHPGHNPGASYAIFAMLALVALTLATGLLMQSRGEFYEEAHSVLAWCTIAVAGLHVLGVIWHSIRFKENITLSMISGLKAGEPSDGIRSSVPFAGIAFLLLVGFWAGRLYLKYDPIARQTVLPLVGIPIPLGENEAAEASKNGVKQMEYDDE